MKICPVPVYLNRPILIMALESDTFAILYVFTILCVKFGAWFFLVAVLLSWSYAKAKAKFPRGFMIHGPYFLGLRRFEGYPDFFQRRFLQ